MLWWLAAVVGIGLISIALSQRRALDPLEDLSLGITSPLERGIRKVASPIADLWEGMVDRGDLVRENQRLKEEIERLRGELARRNDDQRRLEQLERALEVKEQRPDDTLLLAEVIAQDPWGLKRTVAIDRGAADGLDEGMVVLSEGGSLVGTIFRVYDEVSWVRLVTDPDSAVNAQVQGEPPVRGVLSGDLRRGLVLELLPADAEIKEGELVATSGLGGNYPPALVIGTVRSVEERLQAPFKKAVVEPSAPLSRLDSVLVLSSFMPARLEGP